MSTAITGMQTVTDFFQDIPEGVYDYVLPFLIVFAIIYGLMEKMNLFDDNDAVRAVLSIALAFFVTTSTQFGSWMAGFIPSYGLWLVFAIAIALAAMLGGFDLTGWTRGDSDIAYFGLALAIGTAYLIYVQEGFQTVFGTVELPIIGSFDTFSLVILIAAAAAVFWIFNQSS